MKMMKVFKYFLIALAGIILAACQEDVYSPGERDRLDCQGLYFPQTQAVDYVISPDDKDYLTFVVEREYDKTEDEVPYEITMSEEGIFYLEDDYILFEEDDDKAQFRVYISEDYEIGQKYPCTIKVTDPKYVSKYALSSNELSFSVTVVKWELLGEGMWRDDFFASYAAGIGATLAKPNEEKAVKVYQRKDLPGYYRVDEVYTPEYICLMAEGSEDKANLYADYCPAESIYIDASNPDKVLVDWQFAFIDPSPYNYGEVYMCSDAEECFDSGYSNIYGKLKDGSITFPKNSLIAYLPAVGGALYANTSGKQRLVLPGYRGYDYSIDVTVSESVNGVMPVKFTLGPDVAKVEYKVFQGTLSDVDMVSKLAEVKEGKNVSVVRESGVYDFTTEKSGFYTLIACSYDEAGNFKEYTYVKFGYDTADDPQDIDIHLGLIVSDKYGGSGNTKENSMEFYIYGKDIQKASVAIYKHVNYEDFKSSIDSLVTYYMPALDNSQLRLLNSDGYTGVINGLAAGVQYTMIAYVDNGYHSGIFTATAATEGTYNPLDEQFQFYDMPSDIQAASQQDYFKEWELWSIDPYAPGDWERTNRGTVSFAEGKDLYFDSNGNAVTSINKADPSKTMEVISLSGMFPTIKSKYNMPSDAIDFHYYEGYIYSLMTQFEKTKVDGVDAYPTNVYLYYYYGSLSPSLENFAMLGGFVRNPVNKECKDVIAFVGNPTAGADYLAMCLCWFEDAKYQSNGYLFEEEGHIYPILINPESEYVNKSEVAASLPATYSMISKELQKGQTNCVETANGYAMSTIDRFRNLPYNYMENLLDIQVSHTATEAQFTMTKSAATALPAAPASGKVEFIHRTR